MKLTVKKSGETVKAVIMELTPAEALIINHAMRRYCYDLGVDDKNVTMMERMLEVEPIFVNTAEE